MSCPALGTYISYDGMDSIHILCQSLFFFCEIRKPAVFGRGFVFEWRLHMHKKEPSESYGVTCDFLCILFTRVVGPF